MSINACSINRQTINALCGLRNVVPVVQTPLGHGSPGVDLRTIIPPRFEIDDRVVHYEQPLVTVEVWFDGLAHQQQLDVSASQTEFVAVTNLQISDEEPQIAVNIFDINI